MADSEPNIVRVGTILCGFTVTVMAIINIGFFDVETISLPHATYDSLVRTDDGAPAFLTSSVTYTINSNYAQKDEDHCVNADTNCRSFSSSYMAEAFHFGINTFTLTAGQNAVFATAAFAVVLCVVAAIMLSMPTLSYRAAHIVYQCAGLSLIMNWVQGQRIAHAFKYQDEKTNAAGEFDEGSITMDATIPVVIGVVCGLTLLIYPIMRVRSDGYNALMPDSSTFRLDSKF